MWTHAPPGYSCPFCTLVAGGEGSWNAQSDVVWRDSETTAFVSPKWWVRNEGHVLVVPNAHVENVYAIEPDLLGAVYATARRMAVAIRETYSCTGTSMRQHNEPGGNQDVWHLHVHVFPRFADDDLYSSDVEVRWARAEERNVYAERLRAQLA